jgi:hypothetical protein
MKQNKPKKSCNERGDPIIDIEASLPVREAIVESSKIGSFGFEVGHLLFFLEISKLLFWRRRHEGKRGKGKGPLIRGSSRTPTISVSVKDSITCFNVCFVRT